jgi:hypothetical protein
MSSNDSSFTSAANHFSNNRLHLNADRICSQITTPGDQGSQVRVLSPRALAIDGINTRDIRATRTGRWLQAAPRLPEQEKSAGKYEAAVLGQTGRVIFYAVGGIMHSF